MDIVIAIPPSITADFRFTLSGPAMLKGQLLENGYTAKIMDLNSELNDLDISDTKKTILDNFFIHYDFYNNATWTIISEIINKWAKDICACNPRFVGFSVFSFNSQRATRLLSIAIKKHNPTIKIVIGGQGIIPSNFNNVMLESHLIDYYVVGDGEHALLELIKGNSDYPGINGREAVQIDDLDSLAIPDFSDYVMKHYIHKSRNNQLVLPITGSRGCVRNCTFCDVRSTWEKFRYRSGANILKEIVTQINRYPVNGFQFTDSLINGSMSAFAELVDQLSEYRISLPKEKQFFWDSHYIVRPEKYMSPEYFDKLANSGARSLLIGVESGSEQVRQHMEKGFTQEDLDYNLKHLDRVGIKVRFMIIVGYPTETLADFQATLDMFTNYQHYVKSGLIEELSLGNSLILLENTPLHDRKKELDIYQRGTDVNDWVSLTNPTLDYHERLRRRIVLQSHVENLGYFVYDGEIQVHLLYIKWMSLRETTQKVIKKYIINNNFTYDAISGGIIIDNKLYN